MAKKRFMTVTQWRNSYAPTVISGINWMKNQFAKEEMEFSAFGDMEAFIQGKTERVNGKALISIDAAETLSSLVTAVRSGNVSRYGSTWNNYLPAIMKNAGDLFRDYEVTIKYSGKTYKPDADGYYTINIK